MLLYIYYSGSLCFLSFEFFLFIFASSGNRVLHLLPLVAWFLNLNRKSLFFVNGRRRWRKKLGANPNMGRRCRLLCFTRHFNHHRTHHSSHWKGMWMNSFIKIIDQYTCFVYVWKSETLGAVAEEEAQECSVWVAREDQIRFEFDTFEIWA